MRHAVQLLAWLVALVAVTLFPFEFQLAPGALVARWDGIWPDRIPLAADVALNVLLFVPFGIWWRGLGRRERRLSPLWRAGVTGLCISAGIEILQGFMPRRDMSVVDLLANGAGAVTGAWRCGVFGPPVAARTERIRDSASPVFVAAAMVSIAIATAAVAGVLQAGSRLGTWNYDYPLLVGNERSGDRPWRGRVVAVEITDAAVPSHVIRRFAGGADIELPGNRLAAFDFDGPGPHRDVAGVVPALRWTAGGEASNHGARFAPGSPWLESEAPAAALARRMEGSNAFSVRVVCASEDLTQVGPARILSNSMDIGYRNFTIGQQGTDLVVRVRTARTGFNGSRPEIRVPSVFTDTGIRDILVTYDGASLLVATAGGFRVQRTDFTPGSNLAAMVTSLPIEADELPILAAVFTGAAFFTPGIVFGVFATGRGRIATAAVWLLLFATLLEGATCIASGRAFSGERMLSTAAIGALAFALGVLACPPRQVRAVAR
jgi:hypothetical protein